MNTKQIIILAIILGALIAGIYWKQRQKPAELVSEEYAALHLSFDAEQAAKIELAKGKAEPAVTLVKQNDRWLVSNFLNAGADKNKIEQLLKVVREATGEIRGKDPSLFKDFGIADEEAYRLSVFDSENKPLLVLRLGIKKPSYEAMFLRQDGSNSVYLTTADVFGQMGLWGDPATESLKADYWAALNLVNLKVDQVEGLETKRFIEGREIITASVVREPDPSDATKKKWRYTRTEVPFALDVEKIKQFLNTLNGLQASKALDPNQKDYGFSKPHWQMKLGLEGGAEIMLTAAKQSSETASPQSAETKASFIQVTGEPVVFQFQDYHFQSIDIDDSKFFVDNPLAVDPEKTEKLTIHADSKELTFQPKEEKRDALTSYLNDLKTFSVAKLLFDPSEQKSVQSPGRFWVEIQKEGATFLIDVGSMISEQEKQYAAKRRGAAQPFAIREAVYQKLFDNLDRLNPPKT